MSDNENTNGFETNSGEDMSAGEQIVNNSDKDDAVNNPSMENRDDNNRGERQNNYGNSYYGGSGYYQNSNKNAQGYNSSNNYNNGSKKNKNMLPIIIAIACVTVLVIISCVMGAFALAGRDGGSGIKDMLSDNKTTENAEKYEDIGSTNTGSGNASSNGNVTVTDVSDVVDSAMPSVVAITSKTMIESSGYDSIYDFYFGGGNGQQKYEQQAAGSGIIVDQTDTELLIVTNNHVVEGSDSLKVQFDGMDEDKTVDAYIKGTDPNADVAVVAVKLEDIPSETLSTIKKATLGDSDSVSVGEGVIAIGNALGYGQSVTTGIISAKDRTVTISEKTMKLLQTDAAINGGNSGGALLNAKGEVIGINVAKYSSNTNSSASVEGMGFAIPISSVKNIISNLETKKTRTKLSEEEQGYLGITSKYDVSEAISEAYGMPTGVYIYEIVKGGPAEKAGIQAGDILTEFDGQVIASYESLKNVMQYYKYGEKVKVKIAYADGREYKEKEVTVTLGKAEDMGITTTQD